jgi:hypothetical protein
MAERHSLRNSLETPGQILLASIAFPRASILPLKDLLAGTSMLLACVKRHH